MQYIVSHWSQLVNAIGCKLHYFKFVCSRCHNVQMHEKMTERGMRLVQLAKEQFDIENLVPSSTQRSSNYPGILKKNENLLKINSTIEENKLALDVTNKVSLLSTCLKVNDLCENVVYEVSLPSTNLISSVNIIDDQCTNVNHAEIVESPHSTHDEDYIPHFSDENSFESEVESNVELENDDLSEQPCKIKDSKAMKRGRNLKSRNIEKDWETTSTMWT